MPLERYQRVFAFNRIPVIWPSIYFSDYDGSYDWENSGDGADFVADYVATKPLVGSKAHKLYTRATAPAADDYVQAQKNLWLPPTELGRLQLAMRPVLNVPNLYFRASLLWYDATYLHSAQIRFDGPNELIHYRNTAGGWTQVGTFSWYCQIRTWHFLDFYADFVLNEYKYLTINNQVINLSGIPVFTAGSAITPHLELVLTLETTDNNQAGCYVDQLLLTSETA